MPSVEEPGGQQLAPNATFQGIARRLSRATINMRLIAIVLTLAVPLNIVVVAVIWRLANVADEEQRASLLYSARSIATAVDAVLGKYVALGHVLSQEPALQDGSLDAVDAGLRQQLASVSNAWALIADRDGRLLVNTRVPRGQLLPYRTEQGIASQSRAFGITWVHSEKAKFVVTITAVRSARSAITWNRNSAPTSASGT